MPQYLIIIIALVTFLKDSFKGINKKWLYGIGVGIMLYFLYKRFQKSQTETLLNEVGDNVLVQICTDIKDALNPWGDFFGFSLGTLDGTDEDKIKLAAQKLNSSGKTFQKLAETWEKIYTTNLTDALNKEGVKDVFLNELASNTGTIPTSTTPPTVSTSFKIGDTITAKQGYNIRRVVKPYDVKTTAKGTEKYTIASKPVNITLSNGTKIPVYEVEEEVWFLNDFWYISVNGVR